MKNIYKRTNSFQHIKSILEELQATQKWEKKYITYQLSQHLRQFIGDDFFEHIINFSYEDDRLMLYFDNASVKNEFLYHISRVQKTINNFFGQVVVREIKIK